LLQELRHLQGEKEEYIVSARKEMGEYRNPSREEMLRDNAERLKKREKQQEREAAVAHRPRSTDHSPEKVRRRSHQSASNKEGSW
jgi:hypothetical protein